MYMRPRKSIEKSVIAFSGKTIRKFNWKIRPSEMIDLVVRNFEGIPNEVLVEVNKID